VEFLNSGGKIEHLAMLLGAQHHGDYRKTLHAMGQKQAILDLAVEESLAVQLPTGGAVAEPTSIRQDCKAIQKEISPESWVPFFSSQSIPALCFTPHNSQIGVADSLRAP
jgi:hypothetical protein